MQAEIIICIIDHLELILCLFAKSVVATKPIRVPNLCQIAMRSADLRERGVLRNAQSAARSQISISGHVFRSLLLTVAARKGATQKIRFAKEGGPTVVQIF